MAVSLEGILADWLAETWELEAVVDELGPDDWKVLTPAPGWTIAHQIAHLAWTDDALALSLTDPEKFSRLRAQATAADSRLVNEAAEAGAAAESAFLARRWRTGQRETSRLVHGHDPKERIAWFGPSMSPAAAVTARIMETFAHGQDIRDALGMPAEPSPRLRHVIHLGVVALPFSFANRSLPVPEGQVRVEATFGEETWTWGPPDAPDRMLGPALDLALLVTRRRNPEDLDVVTTGPIAATWRDVAQAYAGPPGPGRPARGKRAQSRSAV